MILIKEAATLKKRLATLQSNGQSIGFVPTMGALHEGHISLIKTSKQKNDITVASIFVNPTQFNDAADYQKYPVTIPNDIRLLEITGCDFLFLPDINEMYPEGMQLAEKYDIGDIEYLLEGKYRPGHFQGVCQVVHKLLKIVEPDCMYMGQKDFQQCIVVRRLIDLFVLPVKLVVESTFRESSGLAMSSRNQRLNDEEKQKASEIFTTLKYIKDNYLSQDIGELKEHCEHYLLQHGFEKVDYVTIANAATLLPADAVSTHDKVVALIAATIHEVRLIDNMVLSD